MKKTTIIALVIVGTCLISETVLKVHRVNAAEPLKYYASNQIFKALGTDNIEAFSKATGIQVEVKAASSDTCVYAMMNGYCDVASTARSLYRRHQDYGYRQEAFCLDPLAIIVNTTCGVDNLTEEQLQDIFSGDIKNWKDVGGPDLAIIIVVPAENTAAHKNFRRQIMKHKDLKNDYTAYNSTGVIEAVKYFPNGTVSFISRGAAVHDQGVKTININGFSPSDKEYPYYQIFYYVTKGEPEGDVKKFIDFSFSDAGQRIVRRCGMIPVER